MSVSVQIKNINKKFEKLEALRDITLSIPPGELFGFIGPDGAGKTTLFRLITSLLLADKGSIAVDGLDSETDYKKIRNITGYMPGRFSLYYDLTVEENINFYASIFKTSLRENYHLIKEVYEQIEPFKKRRAGDLSGGMKQKLALSCALIHKPELLILDEPTTGVDAVSRKEFWELLKKMQKTGITILVSTPYMDEASLCDRVALMQKGDLMAVDTPSSIVDGYNGDLWQISSSDMHAIVADLTGIDSRIEKVFRFGEKVHVTTHNIDNKELGVIIEGVLDGAKHKNILLEGAKPQIEDCFLALMDEKG
ncbi:MAG: ABC transporter ATP-binding protein [Chlorobi bacterium]|nr:ABC transporter ATP-binding protein [Chlorobiota bacterium]